MRKNIINSIYSILEYVIVAATILLNYSMFMRDTKYNFPESLLFLAFIAACFAFAFLRLATTKVRVLKSQLIGLFIVFVSSFLSVLVPGKNMILGIAQFTAPFTMCALFFCFSDDTKRFWNKFVNIMTIMAAVSLILYASGTVLGIISPTGVASFRYDGAYKTCNTYFHIQYEAQGIQGGELFGIRYRNTGFFIESPMYNVLLCFAMGAELSFRERARKAVVILLSITILTTIATTGIVFLIVIMIVRILISGGSRQVQTVKYMIFPLLALIAVYVMLMIVDSKQQSSSGSHSVSVRFDHAMAFLKMWLDKPLFGHGYRETETFYNYTNYDLGYSVGLPALLGKCGGVVFAVYLIPWIRNILQAFRKNKRELYFFVGTFPVLLLTAVVYQPIIFVIICFQLMNYSKETTI